MSGQKIVPKHIRLAFGAAQAVLGDRVELSFHPKAKHKWRMTCGPCSTSMSGTPMNREDEARYARQWAQRVQKGMGN